MKDFDCPSLRVVYVTSFGDTTDVTMDLEDETANSLVEGFRRAMLACGYGADLVNDVLGEQE